MMPPRVILAAVDFSEPSRIALVYSAVLARRTGAELHVLHAEHPLLAHAARQSGFSLSKDTEEELDRFVKSASASSITPTRQQHHVRTGPAVEVIIDCAHECGADLLVVGSHGMSGAERLVFGSTTEGLLRCAPIPVLVTPREWTIEANFTDDGAIGPLVVAVDFTPQSTEAAKAACELAAAIHAKVEVVHVVPDLPVIARWRPQAEAAIREHAATARRELEAWAQSLGCPALTTANVEIGVVAERLADAAAPSASRRPILVLGRRAPGERGGAPGATAYRVLTLANVPVLMHVS
jgi:nucleotide-binding universal stress UspA family protein